MTRTCQARIIRDEPALTALEAQWWALWRRVPSATPFQSPAWLLPWWEAFAPGELHSIALHDGERLVGLAPLYLEIGPSGRRILPIGVLVSDYLDVLIDPAYAEAASSALMAAMVESSLWESWDIPELGPEAQAAALPCPAGWADRIENGKTCPYLPLPAREEDLRGAFPPRKRRSLSMNRNRAGRRGALSMLSRADSSPAALLAELVRLHGLRWRSRGEAGVFADPRMPAFLALALPRLAGAGLARLYALRIGEDVAAAYCGFLHGGRALAFLTGIDPAFAFESPGTLLLAHVMAEAIREGASEFDFLRGGEAYKYGWGAKDRFNRRRIIERRLPNGT